MNSHSLITLTSYSFPHEAHIAAARLNAENIPAFVADEHMINMLWLYSNALAGVKVRVPFQYMERAQKVLAEDLSSFMEEEFGGDGISCPTCGSVDIYPYTKGLRSALLIWLFLGFTLFFFKHGYRCNSCGEFIDV